MAWLGAIEKTGHSHMECGEFSPSNGIPFPYPPGAALPGRRVNQAAKAVKSHRTPYLVVGVCLQEDSPRITPMDTDKSRWRSRFQISVTDG